jgi:hypothetical protein
LGNSGRVRLSWWPPTAVLLLRRKSRPGVQKLQLGDTRRNKIQGSKTFISELPEDGENILYHVEFGTDLKFEGE